MSAKISGLVWELELPREEKYVLLCLADHAKHDGTDVYPSVGLIAWKTDYSERRIQELMRCLERRGLLVKVKAQFGRGRTTVYRINLETGTFKEPRTKGAKISPIPGQDNFYKGEIPQGQKGATGRLKGEITTAPESIEPRTLNSVLPPTPLKEGGIPLIWQKVCEYLKDDLSMAYVNAAVFQESAYDKYFRDSWLVEIRGDTAILDSWQPEILCEGVEKFQQRLRDTFRAVAFGIRAVRVKESKPWPRGTSA